MRPASAASKAAFLSDRPGSSNAVLGATAPRTLRARLAGDRQCRVDPAGQDVKVLEDLWRQLMIHHRLSIFASRSKRLRSQSLELSADSLHPSLDKVRRRPSVRRTNRSSRTAVDAQIGRRVRDRVILRRAKPEVDASGVGAPVWQCDVARWQTRPTLAANADDRVLGAAEHRDRHAAHHIAGRAVAVRPQVGIGESLAAPRLAAIHNTEDDIRMAHGRGRRSFNQGVNWTG